MQPNDCAIHLVYNLVLLESMPVSVTALLIQILKESSIVAARKAVDVLV